MGKLTNGQRKAIANNMEDHYLALIKEAQLLFQQRREEIIEQLREELGVPAIHKKMATVEQKIEELREVISVHQGEIRALGFGSGGYYGHSQITEDSEAGRLLDKRWDENGYDPVEIKKEMRKKIEQVWTAVTTDDLPEVV